MINICKGTSFQKSKKKSYSLKKQARCSMEHFDPKMESLLKGNRAILKYTKEK